MAESSEKMLAVFAELEGPISVAAADLNLHVRSFPTGQDFHFYSNFPSFTSRAQSIKERALALCQNFSVGSLPPEDDEDINDWLVSELDERLERVDCALDHFRAEKKRGNRAPEPNEFEPSGAFSEGKGSPRKGRPERAPLTAVPFHVASIPRPQDVHTWEIDNRNLPFLPGTPFVDEGFVKVKGPTGGPPEGSGPGDLEQNSHPLHDLITGFPYQLCQLAVPGETELPLPVESTPFRFVDNLADLKLVSEKLRSVSEFAVDVEHHGFRSFRGLVCLVQISTHEEDFVVDPFPLRKFLGPILGPIFSNPCIVKVMHGSDRDIIWLQRDFGIHVANLFDTGQASRVLEMESFGLAHLLKHFCCVEADKRYQLADWRVRPIPPEMLKYAREDTRYLLHIYDRLRALLFSHGGDTDSAIVEVLNRSREKCLQVHQNDVFTEASYKKLLLSLPGSFSREQESVVKALYRWRDGVAREKDESTGYVLSNNLLLRLARKLPEHIQTLRSILGGSSPLASKMAQEVLQVILEGRKEALDSSQEKDSVEIPGVLSAEKDKTEVSGKDDSGGFEGGKEKLGEMAPSREPEDSRKVLEGPVELPRVRRRVVVAVSKKSSLFGGTKGGTPQKNKAEASKAVSAIQEMPGGNANQGAPESKGGNVLGSFLYTPPVQKDPEPASLSEPSSSQLAADLAASMRLPFGLTASVVASDVVENFTREEEGGYDGEGKEVETEGERERSTGEDFVQLSVDLEEGEKEGGEEGEEIGKKAEEKVLFGGEKLPLSLSRQRQLAQRKEEAGGGRRKRKAPEEEGGKREKKKEGKGVLPDFEIVKGKINLNKVAGEEAERKGRGGGKTSLQIGFEMDLEGLKGGKRSQVYPKSGNRSFTLARK